MKFITKKFKNYKLKINNYKNKIKNYIKFYLNNNNNKIAKNKFKIKNKN